MKEKFTKIFIKFLKIHRDYLFSYKDYVADIKRVMHNKEQIRVSSFLYNHFLMLLTNAHMIFRYTTDVETMENYKDEIDELKKLMKDSYNEVKYFDENPNNASVYVRCNRDKVRKALDETKYEHKCLDKIGSRLEKYADTCENIEYNDIKGLINVYTLKATASAMLLYVIKIMFKYRERK